MSRITGGIVDIGAYEYVSAADLASVPASIVFTQAPFYQTTCDTIRLTNTGDATCTITGVHGCTANPFSIDTTMTSHTIPPGNSTKIAVRVEPRTVGPDSASVTVVSDALNGHLVIPVHTEYPTGIVSDRTPQSFRIVSISPNPFNPPTTVHYTLPSAMPVSAAIWSVTGARVRVMVKDERFEPGANRLVWDGRTDQGTPAASGVYFTRVETRLGAKVARTVLLK